jgi:CDP-glucose 4,6-dehydratase
MNWRNVNVLITGATGMVGYHLCQKLLKLEANTVTIMRDEHDTLPTAHILRGDLTDFDLVSRALCDYEIDTVFHLAAQAVVSNANRSPRLTMLNNWISTINILEACRLYKPRYLVVASSDKAYGELAERRAYVETDPLNGLHPYDCSKSACDLASQAYQQTYDMPIGVVRCGNIYGSHDYNWNRLIPNTIRRLYCGNVPVVWGNGTETRDYIHVSDVVSAYLAMAEKGATGAYNFSGGEELQVTEVITNIAIAMNTEPRWETLGQTNGEIRYQKLDTTKAQTKLDWSPKVRFQPGMRETVAWYLEYLKGQE